MAVSIETIRNIGIVAHIDAGKTTTTERILYYSGESHRMGDVDEGTTKTDFDPEEAQRGITIYSAAVTCHWLDHIINVIDTPGHVDFTAEVQRSLRVLDGAVVIFSAMEGVEAQSETVWRQADGYHIPRICFINKMDRIGASFERTLEQMERRLAAAPVAIYIPIGAGSPPDPEALTGIIDLIQMKALYFDEQSAGASITVSDIPEKHLARAKEWRQKLLDAAAMLDDAVMETFLDTEDVPADLLHRALRAGTLSGQIQPTLCGASKDYIGVQPLLDAIVRYLPSPEDRPPIEGMRPASKSGKVEEKRESRPPKVDSPLACLVFKVQAEQHADVYFVRVYSGKLKSGSRVLNARTGKKELISQLWRIQADSRTKVDEVHAGDIVGVVGPKDAVTGDTLCDGQHPILLESIKFPETVISMAVEPDSSADRKKLADTLVRLGRQDPTFVAKINEETGQTIISGMGELHLEILRGRMERDFGLKVRVHKPRVSYRESVKKPVEVEGSFQRQLAGVTERASVRIKLEPTEGETPVEVVSKLKPDDMPAAMVPLIVDTIRDEARGGGLVGYPLVNVKFTVLKVDYRDGETTEVALQAAAVDAVRKALNEAGIVLLEPIMRLEVVTPDEFMGNIQADLHARRAMIVHTEPRGNLTVVECEVPLSNMFGYSTQVRSLSQGRASFAMEPLKYAPAPEDVLREMMG